MVNIKTTTKKCMKIDKPLVSILLAAYKPNEKWFIEQLESLNAQDYENIELLIWDDCPLEHLSEDLVKKCITNFSYKLYRGEENKGSNFAFEELTKLGEGKYFAYCDHDDIWCKNKISTLVDKLESTNSPLVCCDVYIIDGNGNITGNSIKDSHKRHEFREGEGLGLEMITRNFVMGCASLINSDIAKKAMPFPKEFIHDHWLAIVSALSGRVETIRKPLIYHRKHGGNQTGVLAGIVDRKSFYDIRVLRLKDGVNIVSDRAEEFTDNKEILAELEHLKAWVDAKERYFYKPNVKDLKTMRKFRYFGKYAVLFEYYAPFMPKFIFNKLVQLIKKGIL